MQSDTITTLITRAHSGRYIFIASPWTAMGGGMFRVGEYLLQAQKSEVPPEAAPR